MLCKEVDIRLPDKAKIPIEVVGFFTPEELDHARAWIQKFEWPVRFQLEALLRNGLANTADLYLISTLVESLVREHPMLASDFLRRFSERLRSRKVGISVLQCFQNALQDEQNVGLLTESLASEAVHRSRGFVQCAHVIVTPTRILLEGPYDTQSNRVIRRYYEYRDNFARVEFRDENRLPFYWPADVSSTTLSRFDDMLTFDR